MSADDTAVASSLPSFHSDPLKCPPTKEEMSFSAISRGVFQNKPTMSQVQSFLDIHAYAEVLQGLADKKDMLHQKAQIHYRSYARLFAQQDDSFAETIPMFTDLKAKNRLFKAGETAEWFSEGALLSANLVKPGDSFKERSGESIYKGGQEGLASYHVLCGYWNRWIIMGKKPTGKALEDLLELVRREAYVIFKADEKTADLLLLTEQDLEDAAVPNDYLPKHWLTFMFYGPYGNVAYSSTPLPLLTNEPQSIAKNSKSREEIRAEERDMLRVKKEELTGSKSVSSSSSSLESLLKRCVDHLTAPKQVTQVVNPVQQAKDTVQMLGEALKYASESQKEQLLAEYLEAFRDYKAAVAASNTNRFVPMDPETTPLPPPPMGNRSPSPSGSSPIPLNMDDGVQDDNGDGDADVAASGQERNRKKRFRRTLAEIQAGLSAKEAQRRRSPECAEPRVTISVGSISTTTLTNVAL